MPRHIKSVTAAVLATSVIAAPGYAQQRTGWFTVVDGLAVYQGNSDLSGGGEFSANRAFLRAGGLYRFENGTSAGLFVSYGQFSYDFSSGGNQSWSDIRDIRISAPMRFQLGGNADLFVSPQVRWDYEQGGSASDGRTYGVFAGVSWQMNQSLRIGPAFGVFSELGNSETEVFPALLVDWDIADQWNLSTGTGLGATQGPGVSLRYKQNDQFSFSLAARSERVRFRLDNAGLAPGGVGEDSSIPIVLSVDYTPNPGVSLNAFVGAELNGQLSLESAAGTEISNQSYSTAPIAGLAMRVRF